MMIKRVMELWRIFSAAPHRMMFFAGIVQALAAVAWWLADLGGRMSGFYTPLTWSLSPPDAHAFLMVYGFFPLLIFGFLMTTYPRWMNGETVQRQHYVIAFSLLTVGMVLFYAALHDAAWLVPAATGFLAGWAVALYALLRVYWRARHPDKLHARITSTVLVLGWLLAAAWFGGEFSDNDGLVTLAKAGGIWFLLLPVFFAVSHRMIPFFSSTVIAGYQIVRPYWALGAMTSGSLIHGIMEVAGLHPWLWLVDLPMAGIALYLTLAWRLSASFRVPLLAMLHIGFAWLWIALCLYAAQSLWGFLSGTTVLGRAPLHALVVGYFSSMVLGMVTRVTLGHSGRSLAADRLTWGIFLAFQSVTLLRILAESPGVGFPLQGYLYLVAGLIWVVCFGLWALHFVPIYWRPRLDGKPG